ncbi:ABC transporter permease [Paenibacillus sp. MMS18-CY102]|uniref:ABC transporter permease n=1 Tax=Paenibacillus sp. MMS18-CY102 TaxID=2682849 RepID=UPI001365AD1E|nr:FtsX-like permease family protein [Paenibacillus sp. MMS18-CY102]MWC30070.1 FtsX-like permease family protein [Paenibacillus sp. MMS18-CY102]
MKAKDRIRFVRQNMGKNKSRIAMTVLATAMGCTFLIMIASVAFGLQKSIVEDALHGRKVTQIEVAGRGAGDGNRAITTEDINVLRKPDYVKAVTVRYGLIGHWELKGGYSADGMIRVADMAEESKSGLPLSEGRLPQAPDEAVVGYHFASQLKTKDGQPYTGTLVNTAVSATLTLPSPDGKSPDKTEIHEMKIVGVLEKPAREYMNDSSFIADLSALQSAQLLSGLEPSEVSVYATSANKVTKVSKALRAEQFLVYSVADELKQMDVVFLIMKIGLIFVGTIAVLIASIGIYNTMTMAVTERAPDIGIMKAIGAHPKTIRSVFLLESFGIGVFGAIIGTAVAYVLSTLVNIIVPPIVKASLDSNVPEGFVFSYIPWTLTALSILISAGVAILSGLRPAARATGIDVLRALRRDL